MLYALKGFIAIHRENGITSASMYCCKALTRYLVLLVSQTMLCSICTMATILPGVIIAGLWPLLILGQILQLTGLKPPVRSVQRIGASRPATPRPANSLLSTLLMILIKRTWMPLGRQCMLATTTIVPSTFRAWTRAGGRLPRYRPLMRGT